MADLPSIRHLSRSILDLVQYICHGKDKPANGLPAGQTRDLMYLIPAFFRSTMTESILAEASAFAAFRIFPKNEYWENEQILFIHCAKTSQYSWKSISKTDQL
jgi:hypothetical protein